MGLILLGVFFLCLFVCLFFWICSGLDWSHYGRRVGVWGQKGQSCKISFCRSKILAGAGVISSGSNRKERQHFGWWMLLFGASPASRELRTKFLLHVSVFCRSNKRKNISSCTTKHLNEVHSDAYPALQCGHSLRALRTAANLLWGPGSDFCSPLSGSTFEERCSWLPRLSPTRTHGFSLLDLLFCCGWVSRKSWFMPSSLLCEQDDVGYVFSVYQELIFASAHRTRKFKSLPWGHTQV